VISVNKRVVLEKTKLRQLRVGHRRRSIEVSIDEKDDKDGGDSVPLSLAGRRNATGINLSSYGSREHNSLADQSPLKRAGSSGGSAGAYAFTVGTPPAALGTSSPRKGYSQTLQSFTQIDAVPAEDYFYPESKVFQWQKVAFGEKGTDRAKKLDPLSDKGAMIRYHSTRNRLARQRGHLLKESFAVLAKRPAMRMSRSPYAYDEGDAAAGIIEKETDQKKQALHLEQVSLIRNSGARSTTLLLFHPFEPALVVCGSSDNISVYNAETSERMSTFSNENPKNTRMTSALWVNEASTSLLLTGSNDGTVRIFDVRNDVFFAY